MRWNTLVVYLILWGTLCTSTSTMASGVDAFLSDFCTGVVVGDDDEVRVRRVSNLPMVALEGQGSHRLLQYTFYISTTNAERVAIVHALPTVWFVDPFDERRMVGTNVTEYTSDIVGEWVDLESIEIFSDPITHVVGWKAQGDDMVNVGIKVHARYGHVSHRKVDFWKDPYSWLLSDWREVNFEPFEVVVRAASGQCTRVRPVQEPVMARMVTGATRHEALVIPMTLVSLVSGVLCSVFFSTSRG